ncbi:MAG: peptidoglycan-binding domain-containing protein, partial [Chloroflexota bacterium]
QSRLILEPRTVNERVLLLNLGGLNPLSELSGIKHRLANLGFDCGDTSDEATSGLAAALRAFQEKHGLRVTGEADQATRDKLQELHGS